MKTLGRCGRKQTVVQLRRGEPLKMQHVGAATAQRRQPDRMLRRLQRHAQPRAAAEQPRRQRIEQLDPLVPVRGGRLPEAEPGGDELDLGSGTGERGRELVVVRRREGGRIGEEHAHPP